MDEPFYDMFRFVAFVDWGYAHNNSTAVGERADKAICSMGPALRFDVPGKMTLSFDYAVAVSDEPSDGLRSRCYIEAKIFF